MNENLGLNEALITVNKTIFYDNDNKNVIKSIPKWLLESSIDIYYQINECYGCPLEKFRTLTSNVENFIISTKHDLFLELRATTNNNLICKFNNLNLNHHGHYKINIDLMNKNVIDNEITNFDNNDNDNSHKIVDLIGNNNSTTTTIIVNETLKKELSLSSSSSLTTQFNCSFETIDKGDCLICPIALLITIIFIVTIGEKFFKRFKSQRQQSGKQQRKRNEDLDKISTENNNNNNNAVVIDTNELGSGQQEVDLDDNQSQRQHQQEQQDRSAAAASERISIIDNLTIDNQNNDNDQQQQQQQQESNMSIGDNEINRSSRRRRRSSSGQINNNDDQTIIRRVNINGNRIDSLDAFRGITIAGMIMVNYGGAGYSILEHKAWNGITLADFVFPFFIFLMGASLAISCKSMLKRDLTFSEMSYKIIRRSILLMLIGLCLNSKNLNNKSLNYLRLTGVLQRFSISYLIVALVFTIELTINKWIKAQSLYRVPILSRILVVSFEILTAINYLTLYIYITFYFDYDNYNPTTKFNCPPGYIGPGGLTDNGKYANCTGGAAAWLDRLILGDNHLYNDREVKEIFKTNVTHDPEGILGNTTSILLTLIGLQCGKILLRFKDHKKRLFLFSQWWAILSICCVSIIIIPINKRLWSLTFILLTGSCAYLLIIFLYLIIDVYKCEKTFLLRVLISGGKNSIFLYIGHSLLTELLPWHFLIDETSHLQLLFRLAWATFIWLLIAHYLASKKLFIRL